MGLVNICYFAKYHMEKLWGIKLQDAYLEKKIAAYYRVTECGKAGVNQKKARKRKVIISMTSIPKRIDKVWITIESLLRQTYKPDKILLWLAEDEFINIKLPDKLMQQTGRGLEIKYCENLKSYKKYFFTVKEYPSDYIVTVDDDVIYAESMLRELIRTYRNNKGCVICHRSHYIEVHHGKLRPYNRWTDYHKRNDLDINPTYYNFFTGCAGTLFPMFLMDRKVLEKDTFMRLAPYADDVWMNFCSWTSGMKIKNTKGILGNIISIESSSSKGLTQRNVSRQENDPQIKRVLEYLNININDYL
ncbi:MAG: glycosyltransferase family 2 protein [Lachnospiraceae bacterium]|nr:glycosyltransferase family 2 protein [Lachnospiraceae bacterium]